MPTPQARRRRFWAQLGAYLLIVAIGLFGFYSDDQDEYERCLSGNEIRNGLRQNVNSIYDFGVALATPPVGAPKQTKKQKRETKEFIVKLSDFRAAQLSKISENRTCTKGWFF